MRINILAEMSFLPSRTDRKCVRCKKLLKNTLYTHIYDIPNIEYRLFRSHGILLHIHRHCIQEHFLLPDERFELLIEKRIRSNDIVIDYPNIIERFLITITLLYRSYLNERPR